MSTLNHLVLHLKTHGIQKRKGLYLLGIVILFWALFDGIMTYIVPIVITDSGMSKTLMGIILGTSSIAGALFDFIACKLFHNTVYKRLFLAMFVICFSFPFILFKAQSFLMFVIAVGLWGVYYDLKSIGIFSYVGRFTPREEHSESFGVLQVFSALGYVIAPLIVGFLIADSLNWQPFVLSWIFLTLSVVFFVILMTQTRKERDYTLTGDIPASSEKKMSVWSEVLFWGKVGRILFPVLLLTFFLNIVDSFFWVLGPLVAEGLSGIHEFSGLFMTMYALPPLLVGWIVGSFTRRYGKKRTAFVSLLCGSVFLMLFSFIYNPYLLMFDVFVVSMFLSMAFPSINGAYADYISETGEYEREIEGLEDFYYNLGYVVGPMTAGFLADQLGNGNTFSLIGLFGAVASLVLIFVTPKSIDVRVRLKDSASPAVAKFEEPIALYNR